MAKRKTTKTKNTDQVVENTKDLTVTTTKTKEDKVEKKEKEPVKKVEVKKKKKKVQNCYCTSNFYEF